MKKFLSGVAATLISFGLGCTSAGTIDPNVVDTVQKDAQFACSFLPTALTIANIVAAGLLTAPDAIASAVCTAATGVTPNGLPTPPASVVAPKAAGAQPSFMVGNVHVDGKFVSK